jgi:hypothetical protein
MGLQTRDHALTQQALLAPDEQAADGIARRRVTVNRAESPLAWLHGRQLISDRQFGAGEQLRRDYELAHLSPRVTMRWDAAPNGARRGGAATMDVTDRQIAAKARFHAAVDHLGAGLQDIAWRIICAGEGMSAAERGLNWPARSGRLVLGLALDRLADHYRMG